MRTRFPLRTAFRSTSPMTFKQRIEKVFQHVGYNTNVQLMMTEYLSIATRNNIPQDQLADIVIFSDGGFDQMIGGSESRWNTATQQFRTMFQQAGYSSMPQIKQQLAGTAKLPELLLAKIVGQRL